MVSAENSSFKLGSGLVSLFFRHEVVANSKSVIMKRICWAFMIKIEKAKINYYSIRTERDFIVFLRKILGYETFCIYSSIVLDAFCLYGQGFGADSF